MKDVRSRRLALLVVVVLATTAVSAAALTGAFDSAESGVDLEGQSAALPESAPVATQSETTVSQQSEPTASPKESSVVAPVQVLSSTSLVYSSSDAQEPSSPPEETPEAAPSEDPTIVTPPDDATLAEPTIPIEDPPAAPTAESEPTLNWADNSDGTFSLTWTNLTPQYSLYVDGVLVESTDQTSYLYTPSTPGRYELTVTDSMDVSVTGELVAPGLRVEGSNARGQLDVSGWRDITDVSAGLYHTVGLVSSGSVVATGSNDYGQCDTAAWTGISDVEAGWNHTLGLRGDGTVVAAGRNDYGQLDVAAWTGITKLAAGTSFTVGLKSDGTVVATGRNQYGQRNVASWTDVVDVACGSVHTLGLKSDGTVLYAGPSAATGGMFNLGQGAVTGWSGILPGGIAAGQAHSLGLSGGSVLGCGWNIDGQLTGVSGWSPVVAIDGGLGSTVGLKEDGTVLVAGQWWDDVISDFAPFTGAAGWTGIDQISAQGDFIVGLVK